MIISDMSPLHPVCKERFERLAENLNYAFQHGGTLTRFLPFETYRTPERQDLLYADPRGVTRARAWQSAHQFGMAVDFVPCPDGRWSWGNEHDWDYLKRAALAVGLDVPIVWDRPHVEAPEYKILRSRILNSRK